MSNSNGPNNKFSMWCHMIVKAPTLFTHSVFKWMSKIDSHKLFLCFLMQELMIGLLYISYLVTFEPCFEGHTLFIATMCIQFFMSIFFVGIPKSTEDFIYLLTGKGKEEQTGEEPQSEGQTVEVREEEPQMQEQQESVMEEPVSAEPEPEESKVGEEEGDEDLELELDLELPEIDFNNPDETEDVVVEEASSDEDVARMFADMLNSSDVDSGYVEEPKQEEAAEPVVEESQEGNFNNPAEQESSQSQPQPEIESEEEEQQEVNFEVDESVSSMDVDISQYNMDNTYVENKMSAIENSSSQMSMCDIDDDDVI